MHFTYRCGSTKISGTYIKDSNIAETVEFERFLVIYYLTGTKQELTWSQVFLEGKGKNMFEIATFQD